MIQRHHDYQLTIPSVPPGGLVGVQLPLDSDAEFALRLVRTRNVGVAGFRFRIPRGPYQSNGYRTDLVTAAGLPSRGVVTYPEYVYPANGAILVDVPNTGREPLTNMRILFRGSKRYRDGVIESPTYPDRCATMAYDYALVQPNIPPVALVTKIQIPPFDPGNSPGGVATDADFALRAALASSFRFQVDGVPGAAGLSGGYQELYCTLRDFNYKAFSNEPIHIDDLFGSPLTTAAGSVVADWFPNLFTPEIYIPRTQNLYLDIVRNDPALGPIDLHFSFMGARVLHQ